MKRRDRKFEVPDLPEPVPVDSGAPPGFIAPMNWTEDEILDAMKAFEDRVRKDRGLPAGESPPAG